MRIPYRTTLLLAAFVLVHKIRTAPTQPDTEHGIELNSYHGPDLESSIPSNPVEQQDSDLEHGISSSSLDPRETECYICFEDNGTFPRGGACNIDSIIEACHHQPPCTNNPDWECGHVFCKDCITEWKQSWTDAQLNLPDPSRHNVRFHCPRCMKEKGCPINAGRTIGRRLGARPRYFVLNEIAIAKFVCAAVVLVLTLIVLDLVIKIK